MKWTLVDSQHPRYKYQLSLDDKQLLNTSIDMSSGSIRIGDSHHKRVFLIYKEGFLKNKIVLRNEYGVALLSMITETAAEGEIRYNNGVYRFIMDEISGSFSVYIPDSSTSVLNYKLPEVRVFQEAKKGISAEHTLIAISTWYSLNSVASNEPVLV